MKFKRDVKGLLSLITLSAAPVLYYFYRDQIYKIIDGKEKKKWIDLIIE